MSTNSWRLLVAFLGLVGSGSVLGQETYRLEEKLPVGATYRVRMRVEVNGSLTPPAAKGKTSKPISLEGASTIDYAERVLNIDDQGSIQKTLRLCERMHFRRSIAGQPQELSLRPGVRRLVILRQGHTEVPFSPDGPLTWGEIDAVRTDVFVPALLGLLPRRAVRIGERWSATTPAVQELTDLEKIEEGTLECKLERIEGIGKKRFAKVTFTGVLRGIGEDGTVRHRLQGHYHLDLEASALTDLMLLGSTTMIDADGKDRGKIDGRLVLSRSLDVREEELSDAAVGKLSLEPTADNTQLLYDNPTLGVKFLYSRRWHVAQVMGTQVALATKDGNGILVTVDPPEQVPTAQAFLEESRGFLTKQKARLLRSYTPKRLRENPSLDAFALEAEVGAQKLWLDYYVTAQSGGGATIAARLHPDGLAELRREAERLARSVTITKRIVVKPTTKGR